MITNYLIISNFFTFKIIHSMYIAKNFIYLFCVIIRKKMSIKKLNTLSNITQNLNGKKLTPLKDYKGVVLKLTSKDKKQIEKYNAEIAKLECDLYKFCRYQDEPKTLPEKVYFWNKKDMIEEAIDKLRALM